MQATHVWNARLGSRSFPNLPRVQRTETDMIIINEMKISQDRKVTPQYLDPSHPDFAKKWGQPVSMASDEFVTTSVSLEIRHNQESYELVRKFLDALVEINKVGERR